MNRRKFIKTGVPAAAGATVCTGGSLFSSSRAGAGDRIALAPAGSGVRGPGSIIGCCPVNSGVVIKTVCDVSSSIGCCPVNSGVVIKTVCDINSTKLAKAVGRVEKDPGCKPAATENMDWIFSDRDVDAVGVATPEHWHAPASVRAIRAGSATPVHPGNIACRTGNKQLLFDPATGSFLSDEQANVLARGKYRKGYEIPEKV